MDRTKLITASSSKASQRKRRLARGVRRWEFDRQLCAEPTRRIAVLTLTVDVAEREAAAGWARDFWARARQRWIGLRYFCWLELQKKGRVHYHGVWLNPPHQREVNLLKWVDHAWGHGRTQVRFADGAAGIKREVDYAISYTKKMGRKSYQQRYDLVPSSLRTFMSQRLEIPPKVVDDHLDRDQWQYEGPRLADRYERGADGQSRLALLDISPAQLRYVGTVLHQVDDPRWCTANNYRRVRHVKKPPTKIGGLSQTMGSG